MNNSTLSLSIASKSATILRCLLTDCPPRQLKAVQGALASQRGAVGAAGLDLVECHANGRVMAQSVVVIEILVAHGNAKNTLANQRLDVMDHQVRLAGINETPGQPRYQAAAAVGLAL